MNQIMNILGTTFLVGTLALIIKLFVSIFNVICIFKLFDKAGENYLKALIPFYNTATLAKITDLSPYMGFFMALIYFFTNFIESSSLISIINFAYLIFSITLTIKLAKKFNFSAIIAIVLTFLSPTIFYAILAFGPFDYIGSKTKIDRANHAFKLNGNIQDYEPQSDFFKD